MTAPTLPPLVRALLQPESYPHPVREPIQLVQTHISYIFLTGDFAYKLKKPVNLGFLDFSTFAKRARFCKEELRLNAAIAPDIYLDVAAVYRHRDTYAVVPASFASQGNPDEIVEYLVRMRQFPQSALLSRCLERGDFTAERAAELGRVVARFHARAATNDYIRRFGAVSAIRQAIDDNYEHTRQYIGSLQTADQFERTKAFSDRCLQQSDLFAQRQHDDKIRECHGDLHLNNICFWRGQLHLFDRIEFNEPFRFVDVMYDVAFTVMDLDARDRRDLSTTFLNAYLEASGDWEGARVLPLYLCRQAYVRAKVNSFTVDDSHLDSEGRAAAATDAKRYYRLADDYARPRSGSLTLVCGLSGAGKSTVGRAIARRLGAIHLRSDAIRKHLAGIGIEQRGSDSLYTSAMSERTYDRLLALGSDLAARGYPVILDARYPQQARRLAAIATARERDLPLQIVHCTAPLEVLRDRLQHRRGDVSDATADLLTEQQASTEPFAEAERPYVVELDTTQPWRDRCNDLAQEASVAASTA